MLISFIASLGPTPTLIKNPHFNRAMVTLRDLVDGKVISAAKDRIVILKDGMHFELSTENGAPSIRMMKKQE